MCVKLPFNSLRDPPPPPLKLRNRYLRNWILNFWHLQITKDIYKKRQKKKFIEYALWELAAPLRTVRQALRRRTPWSAQPVRQPWPGCRQPATSRPSSLYMFTREGGGGTPSFTEKQRPWAWPSPWYGSCPAERQSSIRKQNTRIQGQKDSGSRIRIKENKNRIFNSKIISKLSELWSGMLIPDPGSGSWFFYPSRIPDPGVKKAPDPGSGSAHCMQPTLTQQITNFPGAE